MLLFLVFADTLARDIHFGARMDAHNHTSNAKLGFHDFTDANAKLSEQRAQVQHQIGKMSRPRLTTH